MNDFTHVPVDPTDPKNTAPLPPKVA